MATIEDYPLEYCVDSLAAEFSTVLARARHDDSDALCRAVSDRLDAVIGVDRITLLEYPAGSGLVTRICAATGRSGEQPEDAGQDNDDWPFEGTDDDALLAYQRIPEDLPGPALTPAVLERLQQTPVRSVAACRVAIGGERVCALICENQQTAHEWPAGLLGRLRFLTEIVAAALHRRRQDESLQRHRAQLARLLGTTAEPHQTSGHDDDAALHIEEIVGRSQVLRGALARLQEVAQTDSTVLLLGETGTGKELFARAIHNHGPRRSKPLVIVNCAALPPTLIESELFGHVRGAFTGATEARQGRFELAHRGTLVLDEIGDLPLDLQTKLLRVLQEGTFERLGSSHTHKVDVRIIAATHRNLSKAASEGQFRSDLFYRLNVFPIRVPPLRERAGDIPDLVWHIIRRRQRAMHRSIAHVPDTVMKRLQQSPWPGNIRELENVVERALIHSTGDTLRLLDEPLSAAPVQAESSDTLNSVERTHINEILQACRWRINGIGNAADRLGMHPNTLRFRMKKLGIVRAPAASTPAAAS